MTHSNREDEPYSNRFQRQTVEYFHTFIKHTAVVACGNSTINVYLTRQGLSKLPHELGPYEIEKVKPLPDSSEFEVMVILSANWGEVDLEEDPVTADWMPECEKPWEDDDE